MFSDEALTMQSLNQKLNFSDSEITTLKKLNHKCKYLDENELLNLVNNSNNRNSFSALSLNIRSLPCNWFELQNFLDCSFGKNKPTIVCLQEIWSVPPGSNFSLQNFHPLFYTLREKGNGPNKDGGRGGGVVLFVNETHSYQPLNEYSIFISRVFESQFVKVKTGKSKYTIVGNIYKPPSTDIKRFNEILNNLLLKIKNDFKNAQDVILLGDININLLKHTSHNDTQHYLDTLLENGYMPLINLPTRITENSATLIDHILTNINDLDSLETAVITSHISDHLPIFVLCQSNNKKNEVPVANKVRLINDQNKKKFYNILKNQTWEDVLSNVDPKSAFSNFFNTLDRCFEESFPEKLVKFSKKSKQNLPWMTKSLLISRNNKQKLYRKKLQKSTPENINKFKEFNRVYTQVARLSRQLYYDKKFQEYRTDCKKTWQTINGILGRKKSFSSIPNEFISNDKKLSGSLEIANGFNDFFADIGPKLAKKIPKAKKHFSNFLTEPTKEHFVFGKVTPIIIDKALDKLKSKNSSGIDKISSKLLKYIVDAIMIPLCHVFNLSFRTGYIPTCLKTALVKPVFKKGEANQFTNYRPISLLSSFAKLLEKIAANQMMNYLNKYKLLYEHQYGFRNKHNTTQPVIQFLDKVYNALNKNELTISVFIDLTKAFDTCDTDILLYKLNFYGFKGLANTWFESYLKGRKQCTSINEVKSAEKELSCGVPQGSVLGPILFLLFINDLPNATKFFSILFADDTTLQLSGTNLNELYKQTNMELDNLADWFKANKLTLNISKTKYMIFRDKSVIDSLLNNMLSIDGQYIERIGKGCGEESFKFVGINLDESLSWKHHINIIRNKVAGATYALSKLRNLLPSNIKLTIYNSLFKSHIEYGIQAWGNASIPDLKGIYQLQKKAVRYISNAKKLSHTSNLFSLHKILKIHDLTKYNEIMFMHNFAHKKLPASFNNHFKKLTSFERTLGIQLEKVNKTRLKLFPSYSMPKSWNNLSLELKREPSANVFKKRYKNSILESYLSTCTKTNCLSCRK